MANTYVDYTAVASQTDYSFSFEYLRDDHVKVKVNDIIVTNYTIVTSPTQLIRFNTAPDAGATIKIYRDSRGDFSPLVDFVDGSILNENDLDTATKHNLFIAQEASEGQGGEQLTKKGLTHYDAEGNKIINLGTPTANTDASNKAYVDQTIDNSIALGGSPAIVSLGGYDVTALNSSRARSLQERFSDVVNVLDYGASTDGLAADNTTAFNNAIAQGGRIYVPEGQYEVNSITINNSCRIFGEGTIYRSAVRTDAAFTINASDVQIEGLKFKGSSYGAKPTADNSSDNAIEVNGGSTPTQLNNLKFSKLDINGFLGFGIRINYATHVTVDNNNINYMGYAGILGESLIHGKITKNSISYVGTLVSKTAGNFVIGERYKIVTVGTTDFTLIGSADNNVGTEFVATGVGSGTGTARVIKDAYGISLSRDPKKSLSNSARSVNCVVADNNISNVSDWIGIDCHAAYKCIISNNNVYGCKYSVNLQYDDDTDTYRQPCEDIIVSNNVFFGLGSSDETESRSAIICIGYQAGGLINKKIHISGNLIEDSGFYYDPFGAIYISSTEGAVVENNTIVKSVRAGIGVGTYVKDSVFRNNQINGSKAGDSSAFYLYLDDSAGHLGNLFEGNRCYNNTDNPTYDPTYGIAYRSGGTGNTFSKNRIKDLKEDILGNPGTDYLYKFPSPGNPGVSNTYNDLKWILETNSGQSSDTLVSTNTSQIINVLLPRNAYGTFGVSKIAVANMYPFTSANITAAIVNGVVDEDEIEVRVYTVDGSAFGSAFTVSPFLLVHCICWED